MPFYSEWLKRLSNFEVSPNLIWIAGISFVVAFIFLLREFFSWMVKQNEIRQDLLQIRQDLEQLNSLIRASQKPSYEPTFPLIFKKEQEQSLEN